MAFGKKIFEKVKITIDFRVKSSYTVDVVKENDKNTEKARYLVTIYSADGMKRAKYDMLVWGTDTKQVQETVDYCVGHHVPTDIVRIIVPQGE